MGVYARKVLAIPLAASLKAMLRVRGAYAQGQVTKLKVHGRWETALNQMPLLALFVRTLGRTAGRRKPSQVYPRHGIVGIPLVNATHLCWVARAAMPEEGHEIRSSWRG